MLECGFESWLGLECSGFSMWHFLKLVRGFLQVFQFPRLLHWLMVSANRIELKINAIHTLPTFIAELSLRTKWLTMCCT